ncbi:Tn3 family transposase [Paeniglutamicibacter sp. ABSL32-1]|uniref:Tn3 family transposase n=1 Tax=Paeniglutamicibacter quisquiliarum TaxID=2849498 RepID=UPI001C2CD516|nr:Tn3 family transposase [Paeniglutamicibacter quisquiliarum]
MTSVGRTAYPRFTAAVSERQLAESFTPTEEEKDWAGEKTRDEAGRAVLLTVLKCYQRLGYFTRAEEVPAAVTGHVGALLGVTIDLADASRAERTWWRYRDYVRVRMGVVYDAKRVRRMAAEALEAAVVTKDHPADLINVALEELLRAGCELPGYSTLDSMVARIRARYNTALFAGVQERMAPGDRLRLERLLLVDPVSRRSEFETLKAPAGSAMKLGKFKDRIELLRRLDAVGETGTWLGGVSAQRISHFAGQARAVDVDELSRTGEPKRLTLIACLLHETRIRLRDETVEMFCKRMALVHKKGRERLEELKLAHRAESEYLLDVFGEVLSLAHEVSGNEGNPEEGFDAAATGQKLLETLQAAGGLKRLTAAHEAVSAHHGRNYLPLLESFCRAHRSALFELLEALALEATSADASVVNAVNFIRACRKRTGEYVPETLTVAGEDGTLQTLALDLDSFATEAWKRVIRDKKHPGKLARRHLEVCVFSFLAAELRSGDIAVVGADSYAGLHRQMMTWQQCQDLAEDFCSQTGIPATGSGLVEHFKAQLADTARAADAGYPANTDLVLEGDRPLLKRRKGADRRPSAIVLEEAVHERLSERGLLDIITVSAHRLGWHKHFGPASGADPKLRDALGRYCLTVFTYGTLLGPAQVARHMEGAVSAHELYTAGNKHTTAEKITRASAEVINAFAQLDVASVWGDGRTVAADGTQVDTWENNLLAESHIRYGGYGGIAYRHVSDTYIALFSHFIPCGVWEAVYIIEGLLQNDSELQPDTIHADTQGQSLPVFGLAALLGFDLLPRIRDWKDLILYRPDTATRYTHIDSLFGDTAIDWGLIETHWPDLMRTVISIREGCLSSVTLLRRLGNHSRKNRLYRAFRELGRVVRTITLLRYLSDPELREHITAITNRVESFHKFSDWLAFGNEMIGHNDPEHQEKIIKFNELLANIVIYSTACDITAAANELAAEGHTIDTEDLATISPYITRTIRRFGDYVLNLAPPDQDPQTKLDLQPGALFPPTSIRPRI